MSIKLKAKKVNKTKGWSFRKMNKIGSLSQAEKMKERTHVVSTKKKRQHAGSRGVEKTVKML